MEMFTDQNFRMRIHYVSYYLCLFQAALKKKKKGMAVKCFSIAYSKASRRFAAKKIRVAKNNDFLKDIAVSSYYRAVDGNKLNKKLRLSRKRSLFIAPTERPDRDEVIRASSEFSRF